MIPKSNSNIQSQSNQQSSAIWFLKKGLMTSISSCSQQSQFISADISEDKEIYAYDEFVAGLISN